MLTQLVTGCTMTYQGNFFLRFSLAILTVGFIAHIAGMLFIIDGSRHTTISNATLFIPALILCIFDKPLRESLISKKYLLTGLMLIFTIAVALTNSGSENSVFVQFKIALYVILYLATINLLVREGRLEVCLNILFVTAGITAIASIVVQSIMQDKSIFVSENRLYSLGYGKYANFQNPIIAALYYGFFGVYGFSQLLTKRYSQNTILLFSGCVLGLSLFVYCTFARGVWLGYGLAICTTAILHHNERSKKWLLAAAALIVVISISLLPILINQYSRGLSLRDLIWEGWLERIEKFWLTGAGAARRFEICLSGDQCYSQAHNLFLQFFYEFGIVGLVLMLSMLVVVFRQSMNQRAWMMPLGSIGLPLLIFGIVTALFDYHTVLSRPGVYWMIFWLPIGIVLSTQLIMDSQDKKDIA
jgi:O-antigen ligase